MNNYVGEICRSSYERSREHAHDTQQCDPRSHMHKHHQEAHQEDERSPEEIFTYTTIRQHTSTLSRMVEEVVLIANFRGNQVLNEKEEWARCAIPTMKVKDPRLRENPTFYSDQVKKRKEETTNQYQKPSKRRKTAEKEDEEAREPREEEAHETDKEEEEDTTTENNNNKKQTQKQKQKPNSNKIQDNSKHTRPDIRKYMISAAGQKLNPNQVIEYNIHNKVHKSTTEEASTTTTYTTHDDENTTSVHEDTTTNVDTTAAHEVP